MALYKYAPESGATDVLTDAQYQASLDRRVGAQVGLADRALNNKALKQATLFLPAWARLIQEVTGDEVFDTMTEEQAYIALRSIFQAQNHLLLPPGSAVFVFGDFLPEGCLNTHGGAVSRTTYSDLFKAIGTTWGSGDGHSTFNVPDSRAEFLRGFDAGRGVDIGRVFGSFQKPSVIPGNYEAEVAEVMTGDSANWTAAQAREIFGYERPILNGYSGTFPYNQINTNSSGVVTFEGYAHAVRPRNITIKVCIRY